MRKKEEKDSDSNIVNSIIKKNRSENLRFTARADEIFMGIFRKLDEHEKFLKEITEINRNVEQTLCHVLLAIRQNEYLQAWYRPKENKDTSRTFSNSSIVTGKHYDLFQ